MNERPFECNWDRLSSRTCELGTQGCTTTHSASTIAHYARPSDAAFQEAKTLVAQAQVTAVTVYEIARALERHYIRGFTTARDVAADIVQKRHEHYEGDHVLAAGLIRALVPSTAVSGELPVGHPHRHTHEAGEPCTEQCPVFAVPVHERSIDVRLGRPR